MKKLLITIILLQSSIAPAVDSNPFASESAVYKVEVHNGDRYNYGTGVLIAHDKILTNCHVVKHPGWPIVIHRKTKLVFNVTSYYNLGDFDACILTGDFPLGDPVKITNTMNIGEIVWHYGYPHEVEGSGQGPITHVYNWAPNLKEMPIIESASYCNPGSSGGPLLNAKGELVGLNWGMRTDGNANICLSIPAFLLQSFIKN